MIDEAQEQVQEPIEGGTTITLPDPEPPANDNGQDDPAPGNAVEAQEARQSRKERREGRLREEQRRAESAEGRLREAVEAQQRMQEQLAELRGRTEAIQRHQAQQEGDPYERRMADLEARSRRHLNAASQAKDAATADAELNEYHRSQREASVLAARREMAAEFERFGRSLPDPETAGMKVTLSSEFPWLATNKQARDAADGYIGVLRAKGRPNNLATFREACAMSAKDFSLGGAPERQSEGRRAAYNGVSSREGGSDEGTMLRVPPGDEDKLRKMATAARPDLEPEAAWKHWLGTTGRKLARK